MIYSIESDMQDYTIGINGVTAITHYEDRENGTTLYKVFKGRNVTYVGSKEWKVTNQDSI